MADKKIAVIEVFLDKIDDLVKTIGKEKVPDFAKKRVKKIELDIKLIKATLKDNKLPLVSYQIKKLDQQIRKLESETIFAVKGKVFKELYRAYNRIILLIDKLNKQ